jgi:YbbR domain-containing protein
VTAVMERLRFWIASLKGYGRDYVLENTGLKVLAFLITAVLWLSVASRPVSEINLHNVPIEFRGFPDDLIVSKYDTMTARVTLRGPRDTLDGLRSTELVVIADMSGIEPGVRVIQLKVDRGRLPANVDDRDVEPHSIRVSVERKVRRDVPVKPRFDGEPTPGFEVLSWQVKPAQVQIVGAASQVKDITEVSTETVSLTGKNTTFSQIVAIDIGSPSVNISDLDSSKVVLTVVIGEASRQRIVDHVPVNVSGGPPGFRPYPRFVSVKIYGPASVVDALTASQVSATAEFQPGMTRGTEIKPDITISGNSSAIKIRSVDPERVRVR